MLPTKRRPGGWWAITGQDTLNCLKDTTRWFFRQLIFSALPWIAAGVSAFCSPSGKAGRFLDRLLSLAEGRRQ
jgi:hypothetical protein